MGEKYKVKRKKEEGRNGFAGTHVLTKTLALWVVRLFGAWPKRGRRKDEEGRMKKEENDLRERTTTFALRVIRLFCALPKSAEAQVLGKQALRSGMSVGANYREAYRSRSKAEFIAKAGDCLREIEETAYWFELLVKGGIVPAEKLAPLRQETGELIAIFVTIVKRSRHGTINRIDLKEEGTSMKQEV
jgi:four helix bundle protein